MFKKKSLKKQEKPEILNYKMTNFQFDTKICYKEKEIIIKKLF